MVAASEVLRWSESFEPPPEVVVMPGVGHFFDGQLTSLRDAVTGFLQQHGF
jgi:alpha/beta superfamily hydrolase